MRQSGSSGPTSKPPRRHRSFATRPTVCGVWPASVPKREFVAEAVELHRQALALRHGMGDHLGVVDSCVGLGMTLAPVEPEKAARLLGAATALRAQAGAAPTQREAAEVDTALAAIAEADDPSLMELAQGTGAEVDEDATVAMARGIGGTAWDGSKVTWR